MNEQKVRMLQSKRFKNLYMDDGINLNDLNIFIGPNCSGKSNLISILKFLKDCIVAGSEGEQGGKYENAVSQLGGTNILDKGINTPSDINFSYHFSKTKTIPTGLNLDIKLFIGARDSKVTIKEESLYDSIQIQETPFYYYKYHDREIGKGVVSCYDDSNKKSSHFEHVNSIPNDSLGLNLTHKLLEDSENPPERTPVYKIARELTDTISNWYFYNSNDMNLKKIRTSEPKIGPSDIYLSKSGHNLALVIENLIQQDIDFEESLNKSMRSILPITRRFRPARTGLMSVNLQWYFEGFNECFYLNEMSDGAVRMLCWAAILLSPKMPALLVIEEPELGLHVSWMPILAEWIKIASQKTQVIISTHSPDLLDYFTDQIENVHCFSSGDGKYFTINSISKNNLQEKFNEGWKLGDLYRVGDPTVGSWPW
ncbi:MAG: ATPase [Desulfobacteraceae bacterium IS3]|nr:MAG: ATPase [Desulfobacteraceae bacterium IS3]